MKISYIVVMLHLFIANIYCQNLVVNIELDSSKYTEGEELTMLIELKNQDAEDVYIQPFIYEETRSGVEVILLDEHGNIVSKVHEGESEYGIDGWKPVLLKGNESLTGLYPVSFFFGNKLTDYYQGDYVVTPYLVEGKYTLQVAYHYYYTDPSTKIENRKEFLSNKLEFYVSKPKEKEDIDAFNDIMHGDWHDLNKDKLSAYIKKYGNSRYAIKAYKKLILSKRWDKDKDGDSVIKEMFRKFPDSFSSLQELSYAEDLQGMMNDPVIKNDIKNSRHEKYYNMYLERVLKWRNKTK